MAGVVLLVGKSRTVPQPVPALRTCPIVCKADDHIVVGRLGDSVHAGALIGCRVLYAAGNIGCLFQVRLHVVGENVQRVRPARRAAPQGEALPINGEVRLVRQDHHLILAKGVNHRGSDGVPANRAFHQGIAAREIKDVAIGGVPKHRALVGRGHIGGRHDHVAEQVSYVPAPVFIDDENLRIIAAHRRQRRVVVVFRHSVSGRVGQPDYRAAEYRIYIAATPRWWRKRSPVWWDVNEPVVRLPAHGAAGSTQGRRVGRGRRTAGDAQ